MTGLSSSGPPCRKCTAPGDAHFLTCPMLRLPAGYSFARDVKDNGDARA